MTRVKRYIDPRDWKRPRVGRQICFWIPEEFRRQTYEKLKYIAKCDGIGVGELMRRILTDYVRKKGGPNPQRTLEQSLGLHEMKAEEVFLRYLIIHCVQKGGRLYYARILESLQNDFGIKDARLRAELAERIRQIAEEKGYVVVGP